MLVQYLYRPTQYYISLKFETVWEGQISHEDLQLYACGIVILSFLAYRYIQFSHGIARTEWSLMYQNPSNPTYLYVVIFSALTLCCTSVRSNWHPMDLHIVGTVRECLFLMPVRASDGLRILRPGIAPLCTAVTCGCLFTHVTWRRIPRLPLPPRWKTYSGKRPLGNPKTTKTSNWRCLSMRAIKVAHFFFKREGPS